MLRYIIGISILTIGIIILRALSNGKVLRKHQYAFWIVIPLYMILMPFIKIDIPVTETIDRLFSSRTEIASNVEENDISPTVIVEAEHVNQADNRDHVLVREEHEDSRIVSEYHQIPDQNAVISDKRQKDNIKVDSILKKISFIVSAALIVFLIAYNIIFISYCRRNRKYIGRDPQSGLRIYSIRHKEAPFLLFNKIYIDNNSEKISEFTICHEACHFKHCDYLWVLIRYLVLFINWYNPIIWTAFFLSGRDCELACDEEVIKIYGADSSKDYARTLLGLLQQQSDMKFGFAVSSGMKNGYKMMKKRIINIKKPAHHSRKALALSMCSVVLIASMAASIASCFKNTTEKKIKVISEDTPWYNSSVINVESGADPDKSIEYAYQELSGADDNYFVIRTYGRYMEPPEDEIDWDTFDFNSYNFSVIAVIDRSERKVVNTIDLNNGLDTGLTTYEHVSSAIYSDGKITVKTNSNERDYDPLTGALLDTRSSGSNSIGAISRYYKVGEYIVDAEMSWDDSNRGSCILRIKAPDGNSSIVELKEIDTDINVSAVLALSDTTAVIPATTNKGYRFYELDLTTNKLTTGKEKDYDWLDLDKLGLAIVGSDGLVYCRTDSGISKINAQTKSIEEVFNYSWCGINRGIISGFDFDLVECSEESMLFIGQVEPVSMYESTPSDFQIVELTKADKNPHAGKTILELYAYGLDENIGAAIATFNDTNKKYFIEVSDRYSRSDYYDDFIDIQSMSDDEYTVYNLNAASQMSNALAMDIMNGEGPDILINTCNFGQLNNSNYLTDLTPYVKQLDSDAYFTNIIEGSKIDGTLYQLPISFAIYGIYTDAKEAGSSGVGFTLDEYQSYVNNALNGTDIILDGQAVYFSKLFSSMSDKFIIDGKADFSGPEFAELAEYVKDNVPEECRSWNVLTDKIYNYADYGRCYGIGGFYHRRTGMIKNPTILGIPSIDGRGPMFTSQCSVAISAQAVNVDACGEFVKILLSDDIQSYIAMNDNFVLNRNAFRNAGEAANNYYNNGGRECSNGSGVFLPNGKKFSEQNIDEVERVVLSCSKMSSEDSAISIILIEEMPAYFLGQKSLDAVIKIAQNRAQKVLDERG